MNCRNVSDAVLRPGKSPPLNEFYFALLLGGVLGAQERDEKGWVGEERKEDNRRLSGALAISWCSTKRN